jgi:hypothetical protein
VQSVTITTKVVSSNLVHDEVGNVFDGISSIQHEKMATTIGQIEHRTHSENNLVIIPIIILGLGTQRKPPTCLQSLSITGNLTERD